MNTGIGKLIAQYRKERGVSQADLAEHLLISPQAVSKWEREISCPDVTQLPAIADYFNITIDQLFSSDTRLKRMRNIAPGELSAGEDEAAENGSAGASRCQSGTVSHDSTQYIDLSSDWHIMQDVHDAGEELGVFRPEYYTQGVGEQISDWEKLPHLEHLQLALANSPYHGRELRHFNQAPWWYRNKFYASADPEQHYVLRFTNVDYGCKVYVNGEFLGMHEGYGAPFSYGLDEVIRRGEMNYVVVKVWSKWDDTISGDDIRSRTYRINRAMFKGTYEHSDGLIQRDVNPVGIYGQVRVEIFKGAHITEKPDIRYRLNDEMTGADISVRVLVTYAGAKKYSLKSFLIDRDSKEQILCMERPVEGDGEYLLEGRAENIRLWSTWDHGTPWMYDVVTALYGEDGACIQCRQQPLGFSRQEIYRDQERTTFSLNGRKFYVRGTSYLPDVYVSAMSYERYMRDLLLIKSYGFNMVRVHVHTEHEIFYQLCSELGIAVFQDSDFNWQHVLDEANCNLFIRQFLAVVDNLKDYPAIMCWGCMNEPGLSEPAAGVNSYAMKVSPGDEIYRLVGDHDPNRPRIKGSFCNDDLCSGDTHNYIGSLSGGQLMDINDTTEKLNTEYGFDAPGCVNNLRKYKPIWNRFGSNPAALTEIQEYQYTLIKYYTEHYRIQKYKPNSGYIQFMFIDLCPQSFYGLVDYWGMPKVGAAAMLESNQPIGVFMKYTDQRLEGVYLANDTDKAYAGCTVQCVITDASHKTLFSRSVQVDMAADCSMHVMNLDMTDKRAVHVSLLLTKDGETLARNSYRYPLTAPVRIENHPGRIDHELGMRLYSF